MYLIEEAATVTDRKTTWSQLTTFVELADTGSVHAAARRLTVTESAVSASLASLHRAIGVPLFEREGRGLRLTPAGLSYAGYARRILGLLDEARLAALDEHEPGTGTLRVAAVTSAGEQLLPQLVTGFRASRPGVGLELEVGTKAQVWSHLLEHRADLAIAGRPPADSDLVTRAVRRHQLVVVAAPELAARIAATRGDVRNQTWLLRAEGSGTRDSTEALLESMQADPPTLTLGSNGAVLSGAAAGLGVALVSSDAAGQALASGELVVVPVSGTPLDRPYHLVTHPRVSRLVQEFLRYVLVDQAGADEAGDGDRFRPVGRSRRVPRPLPSAGEGSAGARV